MTFKASNEIKEFEEIEGSRMGELDERQTNLAYEKWLRDQFGFLSSHHSEQIAALLTIIDGLRSDNAALMGENSDKEPDA